MNRRLAICLLGALLPGLPAAAWGAGAEASGIPAQVRFEHSALRLLDGGRRGKTLLAGLEIRLADGWKTYWRVPGDAGVPPSFDFSASENLARAEVLWPAPKRFEDAETGETIGYKGMVVFPLRIWPKRTDAPVVLRLNLDYALCNEMCIPARARLERRLGAGTAAERDEIEQWLEKVPKRPGDALRVVRAQVRDAQKRPVLLVTLRGKGLDEKTEIFVEGPALASFCHPRFIAADGDEARYFLPVDGIMKAEDLKGEKLKLTVISGKRSIEQEVVLP